MLRNLALAAAVSFGVAAVPAGALAMHGGGGGGHGGFSGGGLGGRSVSPGFTPHGMPGGNAFVNRGVIAHRFGNGGRATPLGLRHVTAGGRFAWHDHHRFRGRHVHGFIPGFGYGYYWYYGDCWVWTDYGWIDMCGYHDYPPS
jgi:hypothetical protein